MIVGYRRVSTRDQKLDRQDLSGCERVFEEHMSGKSAKNRPALREMIDFIRDGDLVKVWSVDRLGRSLTDLSALVDQITAKGAEIEFISENLKFSKDSDDPFRKMQFQMLGMFAEFERSMTERRRQEGIQAARANGSYKGLGRKRKPFDVQKALEMHDSGMSVRQIAEALNAGKTTVHAEIKKHRQGS